jgi:hypothetical protein
MYFAALPRLNPNPRSRSGPAPSAGCRRRRLAPRPPGHSRGQHDRHHGRRRGPLVGRTFAFSRSRPISSRVRRRVPAVSSASGVTSSALSPRSAQPLCHCQLQRSDPVAGAGLAAPDAAAPERARRPAGRRCGRRASATHPRPSSSFEFPETGALAPPPVLSATTRPASEIQRLRLVEQLVDGHPERVGDLQDGAESGVTPPPRLPPRGGAARRRWTCRALRKGWSPWRGASTPP